MKSQAYLFTDGSVNPQSGMGFGAYLFLEKLEFSSTELDKKIKIKRFDILDCEFMKVKGHKKASMKNDIDEIFTLVDRATRSALRKL